MESGTSGVTKPEPSPTEGQQLSEYGWVLQTHRKTELVFEGDGATLHISGPRFFGHLPESVWSWLDMFSFHWYVFVDDHSEGRVFETRLKTRGEARKHAGYYMREFPVDAEDGKLTEEYPVPYPSPESK